jgi:hypothetical protein
MPMKCAEKNDLPQSRQKGAKTKQLGIPLMPTDDSEVMPTGVPLRSRPMFRWNADRLMMQ